MYILPTLTYLEVVGAAGASEIFIFERDFAALEPWQCASTREGGSDHARAHTRAQVDGRTHSNAGAIRSYSELFLGSVSQPTSTCNTGEQQLAEDNRRRGLPAPPS